MENGQWNRERRVRLIDHLRLSVFVMGALCLVSLPQVSAQEVVEVESDIMEGLSTEDDLEHLQAGMAAEEVLEIETELTVGGAVRRPPADRADEGKEETAPAKKEEDVLLEKELLDAEFEAARVDLLSEEEILKINESLKRAIQQNRRLQEEKGKLNEELQTLRGEQRVQGGRVQAMEAQVEDYQKRIERTAQMKKEFEQTVSDLQNKIKVREEALLDRVDELQKELTSKAEEKAVSEKEISGVGNGVSPASSADGKVLEAQETGLDVIELLDEMEEMRRQMRVDEAKVHYNMGNIFFHQGRHDDAVAEYQKTLEIVPDDANAHFNLAYISGEFLHEYKTAVEHYQQYLFLDPGAEDAPLVKEKIIEAQLFVRTSMNIDSDKEVQGNKPFRSYTW